jgi:hypothetical protein
VPGVRSSLHRDERARDNTQEDTSDEPDSLMVSYD